MKIQHAANQHTKKMEYEKQSSRQQRRSKPKTKLITTERAKKLIMQGYLKNKDKTFNDNDAQKNKCQI